MIQLNENTIAVGVPVDAELFKITAGGYICYKQPHYMWSMMPNKLSGNWQILGTFNNGIVDFDCEELVDRVDNGLFIQGAAYENYMDDEMYFDNPLPSFTSLLQSKGADLTAKYWRSCRTES